MALAGHTPLVRSNDDAADMHDLEGPAAIREKFSRILEGADASLAPFAAEQHTAFSPAPMLHRNENDTPQVGGMRYYSQDLQIAATKVNRRADGLDFSSIFPGLFTFTCMLVFMPPIWITLHLGEDENVQRWVGPWCQIVAVLPLLFVYAHFVHRRTRIPNKGMVAMCLLTPSLTLLAVSDIVATMASGKSSEFSSTDCDLVPLKRDMEHSWQAANGLYQKCLQETVPLRANLTMATARRLFRLQDCEEYNFAYQKNRVDWDYLRALEEKHSCGGWCSLQRPLWTRSEVSGPCTVAAATVMRTKVGRPSLQVVVYSVFTLMATVAGLVLSTPMLRRWGVEW